MSTRRTPPGWPAAVLPAGAPDWERSAVNWLLDVCPPDYRGYAGLRRHPRALAWLAARHVAANREAMNRALATVRADLSGELAAGAVQEVVEVLELEQVRMLSLGRGVALVGDALGARPTL